MARALKLRELKRLYDVQGAAATCDHLQEALAEKHLRPEDFSVRDLTEVLVGREFLDAMQPRKSGRMSLFEAANAVDTSAFSNITGQILYNKILQGYENPAFLWPSLCETVPTTFLDGEKIPGISRIGDVAEQVDEGMPYPFVGLSEEFVETVRLIKRGFILPLTREIIIADRTGILLRNAGEGGKYLGINKEKRVIDLAIGVTNNYKRNGTATNTYLTTGAYVNVAGTNSLVDWTDIEKAELLFDALNDPTTGEPIVMPPSLQLLVPTALKYTAKRIVSATEIQHVDNQAAASTIRTSSSSPVPNYQILSSPYVGRRTGDATTWFLGDFKGAIAYMEAWGIEPEQADSNAQAKFLQDIWMQYKVSEMGAAQMLEPRRLTKSTAA